MVDFKKQTSLILILSLFLSLIPNFLYNENREVFASEENPCEDASCPNGCAGAVYDEDSETCVCPDCSISCPWEAGQLLTKLVSLCQKPENGIAESKFQLERWRMELLF